MQYARRTIYVVDVVDAPSFAFEAQSPGQTEAYTHAPRFLQSLSQFFAQHDQGCQHSLTPRTRPASETEAAIYLALADEFAETSGCFFVAHLGSS
jgi:hypothetical protein